MSDCARCGKAVPVPPARRACPLAGKLEGYTDCYSAPAPTEASSGTRDAAQRVREALGAPSDVADVAYAVACGDADVAVVAALRTKPTEDSSLDSGVKQTANSETGLCHHCGRPQHCANTLSAPKPTTTVTSGAWELREDAFDHDCDNDAGVCKVVLLSDALAAITTAEQRGRDEVGRMFDFLPIDKGGKPLCPHWTEWEREHLCATIAALRTKDTHE